MTTSKPIDFQTITAANVYLRRVLAGTLIKLPTNDIVFSYDANYLHTNDALPIARSLPLTPAPYIAKNLHPFFDNLIIEGWLLNQAEKMLHIDKNNRFAMLMAVGQHVIGAVHISAMDSSGQEILLPSPTDLESEDNKESFNSAYKDYCSSCLKPVAKGSYHPQCQKLLWGTTKSVGLDLDRHEVWDTFSQTIHGGSISGAQRKGFFRFDKKRAMLLPTPVHATHVLKPQGDRPELPENEHLTMAIARHSNFKVPPVALVNSPSLGNIFVIKRFDRIEGHALLQEDAAQLLGIPSHNKYTASNERVAQAFLSHGNKLDLNEFFRRMLFCFTTGNGDMHLKNWSLLESTSKAGVMLISPCYDFLNTRLALPKEDTEIGLPLLGKNNQLKGSYFRKFAETHLELNKNFIEAVFEEVTLWLKTIDEFTPRSALSQTSKERYMEICHDRARRLIEG